MIDDRKRANVHRTILDALALNGGQRVNHLVLRSVVEDVDGLALDADEVREHLSWLEDRGAVATEQLPPFTIATLTDYGLALAEGRASLDGVGRPLSGQD